MKAFVLALVLTSCSGSSPSLSFDSPCFVPAKVTHFKKENTHGCWRVSSKPGYGVTLKDPGPLSCDTGSSCIVIADGEPFWTLGAGNDVWIAEDIDCSEVCP